MDIWDALVSSIPVILLTFMMGNNYWSLLRVNKCEFMIPPRMCLLSQSSFLFYWTNFRKRPWMCVGITKPGNKCQLTYSFAPTQSDCTTDQEFFGFVIGIALPISSCLNTQLANWWGNEGDNVSSYLCVHGWGIDVLRHLFNGFNSTAMSSVLCGCVGEPFLFSIFKQILIISLIHVRVLIISLAKSFSF